MKRNITINMQGRLYAIDEDAYDLLKQYEDSLRGYFAGKEGGSEIVDDLEARIAELFDEVRAAGKVAIDIGDVQRIITRIGNPQQMDDGHDAFGDAADGERGGGDDGNTAGTGWDDDTSFLGKVKRAFVRGDRRFYRDTQDKKIFGVMSGLAHYYGGDVTWWRLFALLACVLFFTMHGGFGKVALYMVVVYFFLGMVVPPSVTPEDRLRMNGKDVNPRNLAEEVTSEDKVAQDCQASSGSGGMGCLGAFADLVLCFVKIVMWLVFGGVVLCFVGLLVALLLLLFVPSLAIFSDSGIVFSWVEHPWVGSIGVMSFLVFIVLGIYGVTRGFMSRRGERSMSSAGRVFFIVMLIASLAGSMACGTIILSDIKDQVESHEVFSRKKWEEKHTHDGRLVGDTDWKFLQSGGWRVLSHEGYDGHYTACGECYTGNDRRRFLDSYDGNGMQLFRVERTVSGLVPGVYRLTAAVRSDGTGAYVYAMANGRTYKAQVTAEGNTGGRIWQDAKAELESLDADSVLVGKAKLLRDIAETNDGNGYGWSWVTVDGIVTEDGKISYGLTTVPEITGDQFAGTWFSASDFKLTKQ